jgi:plasmid segregation protein ParM
LMKKQGDVNGVTLLGVDVGFGYTKVVTDDQAVIFPSVRGKARQLNFQGDEITKKYPGDQLFDDGEHYFVGDLANAQLIRPGELRRLQGRTADERSQGNLHRLAMLKVALGKLYAGRVDGSAVHLRIATGLPVTHMGDSAALKETLIGQHQVRTDQADFVANVTGVMVLPQPYGTLYAVGLDDEGDLNECQDCDRQAVIDAGHYTVDMAVDHEGEYIAGLSDTVESGVYTAHETLRQQLEAEYRQVMPPAIVAEVLRTGCFRAAGKVIDYRNEIEDALATMREATLQRAIELWQQGTLLDIIYLSGGGAGSLEKIVKKVFPQARLVDAPQMANARGFLRYAKFKSR